MTAFADNLQKVMDTKGLSDYALYGDWLSAFGEEQQQFLIHPTIKAIHENHPIIIDHTNIFVIV